MYKLSVKILLTFLMAFTLTMAQKVDFRTWENKAFDVGEKLIFNVKYGFVTGGIAEMAIPKMKRIAGRDVYHVTFKVNSVPAFDPFFKVRDRYETYLDKEGIFPWRFEQHIREGGFSKDYSAFFDQRKGKAKTSEGSYDIERYTNDIVSAFYFTRTLDWKNKKQGDKMHLENFFDGKTLPLDVVFHKKETITVAAGTFDCIVIEPLVVDGGLFKSEGNILIWLTDDELKIPVQVKTKVVIGSIVAELIEYEGLAGKLISKK